MKHHLQLLATAALAASMGVANASVSLSDVSGGDAIYGYMISTESGKRVGSWNRIADNGDITELWKDTSTDYYMLSGWMRRGMLCEIGLRTNAAGTTKSAYSYITRNVESGEIYKETRYAISQYRQSNFSSAAYCGGTEEGIYGYVMDPDYDSYPVWKKAPANGELTKAETIKVLDDPYSWCPSLCYSETDGCFYGVSYRGNVVKVSMDGDPETIFELEDAVTGDPSALSIFQKTGKMLWSGKLKDGTSAIYCIDLQTRTCEKVMDLNARQVFMGFFSADSMNLSGIPAPASDLKLEFSNGSSDGVASFMIPSTTMAGQQIDQQVELEYNLLVDDDMLLTGKGLAGRQTSCEVKGLEQGEHTFYLSVIYDSSESSEISATAYVGNDTPLATASVSLSADGYTLLAEWKPVTEGVHGGWVDASVMSYDVYLNSEYMETTSALTWEYYVEEGTPLAGYIVSVVAKCNGLESSARNSKAVACGDPMNLDVYIAPTAEQSALMTYISDSETSWKFNDSYEPPVFSSGAHYTTSDPLDTWLIMPPIKFPKEGEYILDFKTGVLMDYDKGEYFSVYIGKDKTAEAMQTQIVDEINPTEVHPDCDQITESFKITEPGTYYIGFHCTSEARKVGALLWDINVMTGSGVSSVDDDGICAYGAKGVVVADGNKGDIVTVCSLDGKIVASAVIGDSAVTFDAGKGIYTVSVGGKSFKVLVK